MEVRTGSHSSPVSERLTRAKCRGLPGFRWMIALERRFLAAWHAFQPPACALSSVGATFRIYQELSNRDPRPGTPCVCRPNC
jgi:hypothetical protein